VAKVALRTIEGHAVKRAVGGGDREHTAARSDQILAMRCPAELVEPGEGQSQQRQRFAKALRVELRG